MSDEPDISTVHYVDHDDTGRIIGPGMTQRVAWEHHKTLVSSVEGTGHPDTHYVLDGQIVERPTLAGFDKTTILADDTDTATLVLPEPMIVTIDGIDNAVSGALELTSPMPATYAIRIRHFPYRDFDAQITAT